MKTPQIRTWSKELGFFAHSTEFELTTWEPLVEHLEAVARRASEFATAFDAGEWGYLAGLWHDLGKFQPDFQRRLCGAKRRVEHSGAGAAHACPNANAQDGKLALAFAIAGHHCGLANLHGDAPTSIACLTQRLTENGGLLAALQQTVPSNIWKWRLPPPPVWALASGRKQTPDQTRRMLAFFTRMLFSALVDADSLETERFYGGNQLRESTTFDSIATLRAKLDEHLDGICAKAQPTPVNRIRAQVLSDCRARASDATGCFSLTVPTGGGKTLSGLAFALNHAVARGLQRVIVVVPYTSIIEQNAGVYRKVLSDRNIVEHHSNLDDFADIENDDEQALRQRLACENWNAPIVVTTNVQFFESLFANQKSRCRKLHNIAKSVIILDEAQSLPVGFLAPVLEALGELTKNYGCTVVLCTATQPALKQREKLPAGLASVTEIMSDPTALGNDLRRVDVHWPSDDTITTYESLSEQIAGHRAALAVVHRRNDAAKLFRLLSERCRGERVFHLSALMCPAHRRKTIADIHQRLTQHREDGRHCRVVSTQLVEAGVDLDFPVVFRAMAGMDSIAQAAGRCNREGILDRGDVYLFNAETAPPGLTLERALGTTNCMLKLQPSGLDINDPAVFKEYFSNYYQEAELDTQRILRELAAFKFETVGKVFRLIEDGYQQPIVIPWDKMARQRVKKLRKLQNSPIVSRKLREVLRSLQPYTVQIQPQQFNTFRQHRLLEPLLDQSVWVLSLQQFPNAYDSQLGLIVDDERAFFPETKFG